MHFEKPSKQFTEFLKKLGSKKRKASIDRDPAKDLEKLFELFLFILKPTVLHHDEITNQSDQTQSGSTNQLMEKQKFLSWRLFRWRNKARLLR